MINNVSIEYFKNVPTDKIREDFIKGKVNEWLKPYTDDFNREDGIVNITIGTDNKYNCAFKNISDELRNRIDIYMHPLKAAFSF